MRKKNNIIVIILIAILLVGGISILHIKSLDEKEMLSLEYLKILISEKKNQLSWSDFEDYHHIDIGSGRYVYQYPIDENYYLLIIGSSLKDEPSNINLIKEDEKEIDVRYDDLDEFLSK